MNSKDLQVFIETFRHRSFVAVARLRNVDPSSVSRTIRSLEEELGVHLFQRTTRRLRPTEAGTVYFERVKSLVDELNHAQVKATDAHEHAKGMLRIAAPQSFAELNILPLLPQLAAKYPELGFDLVLTDAAVHLIRERIDVAIRLGPLDPSGLVAYCLCRMSSRVCASPDYIRRAGRPKTPDDLQAHNCLLLDMPGFSPVWRFKDKKQHTTRVRVQGRLRTSNALALKECAINGIGIILQDRWIVGRELQSGALVNLFPDYEVTAADFEDPAIWILYPTRAYVPIKVRVLVDFLKEAFRAGPPGER